MMGWNRIAAAASAGNALAMAGSGGGRLVRVVATCLESSDA